MKDNIMLDLRNIHKSFFIGTPNEFEVLHGLNFTVKELDMFKITNQDFDCIFCNNDTMALGAVQWLKDNGYNPADYPVTGVDATADGCALVKSGDMYMTVLQDAKGQGNAAVQACIKMANGQSITSVDGASEDSKYVWVPFVPVDASNVAQYQ